MKKILLLLSGLVWGVSLHAGIIRVVAAENFYGDVALMLGQPYVQVTSVLMNPASDPHLYSPTPDVAKAVENADIVIENGLGYDVWMDDLYASSSQKAMMINVGSVLEVPMGHNPHIWYSPVTMPVFAKAFTAKLIMLDPADTSVYQKNLAYVLQRATLLQFQVDKTRKQVSGMRITVTEPIFNDMAHALDLKILNDPFAWEIMNGANISPRDIAAFQQSLNTKAASLLIYNNQVTDPTTSQLKALAIKNGIPVIGVSELMPPSQHYYQWMQDTLAQVSVSLGAVK